MLLTNFVNDVLLFLGDYEEEDKTMKYILEKFISALGMMVNYGKSVCYFHVIDDTHVNLLQKLWHMDHFDLTKTFKYLIFFLKPTHYKNEYWDSLIEKFEVRVTFWCNRFLFRGGKSVCSFKQL